MRYATEHKTQTRRKIVQNAARKLRAEGLRGPGVASVMEASGLTVGGFYKHFRNKDDLFLEAIAQGFSEFRNKVFSSLEGVPPQERWKAIVRWYLSPEHCGHPEAGCPLAALAPEIARAKLPVRKKVAAMMKEGRQHLMELMPGTDADTRERNFFVIFSAMEGAVSVARILPDAAERERVLGSVRDYLLKSF